LGTGEWLIDSPPTVPILQFPINGATISDNTPLMQWSDSSDENGISGYYYRVFIGSQTGSVWPNEQGLFRVNSEYQAGTTADNDYYWQVRAEDNNGNLSDWSNLEHVIIDTSNDSGSESEEGSIVINEILPNPVGEDFASKPNGEWVELYNKSDNEVDVNGWYLYDDYDSHELEITSSNTDTEDTIIPASGFLVVYRNEDSDFSLNNGGDRVRLFNAEINSGEKIDEYEYGAVSEGESWARETAGADNWVKLDTPNLGTNPHSHIDVDLSRQGQEILISFENAFGFNEVKYAINYQREFNDKTIKEQIVGSETKELDQQEFSLTPIYLGTCSSLGEVCTPHTNISEVTVSLMYKKDKEILGTSNFDLE
jgi:hypothetical protein